MLSGPDNQKKDKLRNNLKLKKHTRMKNVKKSLTIFCFPPSSYLWSRRLSSLTGHKLLILASFPACRETGGYRRRTMKRPPVGSRRRSWTRGLDSTPVAAGEPAGRNLGLGCWERSKSGTRKKITFKEWPIGKRCLCRKMQDVKDNSFENEVSSLKETKYFFGMNSTTEM